jgi:hypothetical protein
MLHAAHEGRAPALVACTPPFAAEPPNKRILRIRSEERSHEEMRHDLLELIGSVPADYTPLFMNQSYIIWK